MGENILKALVFLLLIPLGGAVLAYSRGRHLAAIVWNGIPALLVLACSGVALVISRPPVRITVGGMFPFLLPLMVLGGCIAEICTQGQHAALFWGVWVVNLAGLMFLIYLAFFLRIF